MFVVYENEILNIGSIGGWVLQVKDYKVGKALARVSE